MISIIIPVYNQAEKLKQCLESIKNQSYDNYEIIIVNDGSSDNVNEIIDKYKPIFTYKLYYFEQENKGSNPARNRGAKIAKGEYLLFCDADIIMKPEMLKIMLDALRNNPKASYAYSSFKYGCKIFKLWPFNAEKLKQMPYIHTTSLMCKERFPGFDESIKRLQDWDLWLTMLEQGHSGIWIDKVLFTIKGGGYTMSSWLPSFAYKLFPFLPSVKKYNEAVKIIKEKYKLS